MEFKRFLPNLFTLLNLSCGIVSIFFTVSNNIYIGSFFLVIATIFDLFDGKLARVLKVEGRFGVELDSLADLISFGIAPGFLLYNLVGGNFSSVSFPLVLITIIYVIAATLRLAYFNLIAGKLENKYFLGIPTTFAGLMIGFLVCYNLLPTWFLGNFLSSKISLSSFHWFWIGLFLSILMITSIPYPKFSYALIHKIRSYFPLKILSYTLIFGLIFIGKLIILLGIFIYIISPIVLYLLSLKHFFSIKRKLTVPLNRILKRKK